MAISSVPRIRLNTGNEIPMVGLGVCKSDALTAASVVTAIEAGYRLIDTAKAYGNEAEVGEGIRSSGIARGELFVTSKLSVPDMEARRVRESIERSLERLDIGYLDLYLLHWPVVEQIEYSWKILEEYHEKGLIRNIGVSNFQIHHLQSMQGYWKTIPAVNQFERHPLLVQTELIDYCRGLGIAVEAWSPLGRALIFDEPLLMEIAARHNRSVAQIVLRWHVQNDVIVIPKSVHPARIRENIALFDFELSPGEMAAIDSLNRNHRFGSDPDNFHFDV